MPGIGAERTLIVEVMNALGVGGVTACLLVVGYGIGWLWTRCVTDEDDNAPR